MKRLLLAVAFVILSLSASAYDFSATAPTGQTLYYSYVDGGVEVTYPATVIQPIYGWTGYTKPSGALIVPATVTYGGTPYSVVAIHGFAFYECTGLTSVVLPEGVTSIGNSVFNGCTSMTQITLPSTLTTFVSGAHFYYCTALSLIVCYAVTPPSAVTSTFSGVPLSTCVLHVPCTAVSTYSATAPWSGFANVVGDGCSATITVASNNPEHGTVTGGGTYSVDTTVTITAVPAAGYFFACWDDGNTSNPRTFTLTGDVSFTAWFFEMLHDTVEVHDTLTLHDTTLMVVVHEDTIYVHDTTVVNMVFWDTMYVRDTVAVEGTDTLYVVDTTYIHDTILPTFFRLQVNAAVGGVGVGNGVLPAGTVAEIGALPLEGYRFSAWNDGNTENPRQVTLTTNMVYTASFEVVTGIDAVAATWTLTAEGREVAVGCDAGAVVKIFSADGRCLMQHTATDGRLRVWMPAAGVYLVQVDQMPARKVVITK